MSAHLFFQKHLFAWFVWLYLHIFCPSFCSWHYLKSWGWIFQEFTYLLTYLDIVWWDSVSLFTAHGVVAAPEQWWHAILLNEDTCQLTLQSPRSVACVPVPWIQRSRRMLFICTSSHCLRSRFCHTTLPFGIFHLSQTQAIVWIAAPLLWLVASVGGFSDSSLFISSCLASPCHTEHLCAYSSLWSSYYDPSDYSSDYLHWQCGYQFIIFFSLVLSVLWCCWLVGRKGIWPVKNWVVGCWHGYLSGVRCRLADATATLPLCVASVKSRLVLPF